MNNDALNDNTHWGNATKALSGLFGQWIEGINVDRYGQISGLITSRGWVIRAPFEVPGLGPVEMDDSRIRGSVIVNVEVLPTGSLTLACVYFRKDGDVRFPHPLPGQIPARTVSLSPPDLTDRSASGRAVHRISPPQPTVSLYERASPA